MYGLKACGCDCVKGYNSTADICHQLLQYMLTKKTSSATTAHAYKENIISYYSTRLQRKHHQLLQHTFTKKTSSATTAHAYKENIIIYFGTCLQRKHHQMATVPHEQIFTIINLVRIMYDMLSKGDYLTHSKSKFLKYSVLARSTVRAPNHIRLGISCLTNSSRDLPAGGGYRAAAPKAHTFVQHWPSP
ncbi:hypothetical protein BsWGS_19048 [Bradybaena similaris]